MEVLDSQDLGAAIKRLERGGELAGIKVMTSQDGDYLISQDNRPVDKAQTYDEATTRAKAVKRRHPENHESRFDTAA